MPKRPMKYNPAFLSDEDLERSFVVRQADLEWILRIVGENKGINQHILVIGPRGSGKTTLVLRVAAEVRRRPELSAQWYPLLFAEESYQVQTPGEFWLEAVLHLAAQTGDPDRRKSYAELQREKDEVRLRERALAHLLDFADSQGKRLLLVVENLNDLLGEGISDEDAWVLRHTLTNEPRIMLLASAVSRFEQVDNESKAMFELFLQHELQPLSKDECRSVWEAVSGERIENDYIRPIQILTGGNLRLLSVIAHFGAGLSFQDLMQDLLELIDDNTDYFKSHIEALPPAERRVYLSLTEIWDPATAREVAEKARVEVSQTSASLNRLIKRGMVRVYEEKNRTKLYCTSERLYSIYYLLRKRGMPTDRVRALVNFMTAFYAPPRLAEIVRRIAEEACQLQLPLRNDHYCVYDGILQRIDSESFRRQLISDTPAAFFTDPNAPANIRRWIRSQQLNPMQMSLITEMKSPVELCSEEVIELVRQAQEAAKTPTRIEEAEQLFRHAIEIAPSSVYAVRTYAMFLDSSQRLDEALEVWKKAAEIDPDYSTLVRVTNQLGKRGLFAEAAQWAQRTIDLNRNDATGWFLLGQALSLLPERTNEALNALAVATNLDPELPLAWSIKGSLLTRLPDRDDEALAAFQKVVELEPKNAVAWKKLGLQLYCLEDFNKAIEALRKAADMNPDDPLVWKALAESLVMEDFTYEGSLDAFRKAVELNPEAGQLWAALAARLGTEKVDGAEFEYSAARALSLLNNNSSIWVLYGIAVYAQKKYEDAVAAFNQAVQLDPDSSFAWAMIGHILHIEFRLYEAAETPYRRALELDPSDALSLRGLIELLCSSEARSAEAISLAERYLKEDGAPAYLLNSVAWSLYTAGCVPHIQRAVKWARVAVNAAPENNHIHHTLACVLCATGSGLEALEHAELYFQDEKLVVENIENATELVVALAAAGQGLEALELLKRSPAASALEPLEAGLRRFLGQETKVALEIHEVGKDVAQRIEDRCRRTNETAHGQSAAENEGKALDSNDTGNDV